MKDVSVKVWKVKHPKLQRYSQMVGKEVGQEETQCGPEWKDRLEHLHIYWTHGQPALDNHDVGSGYVDPMAALLFTYQPAVGDNKGDWGKLPSRSMK